MSDEDRDDPLFDTVRAALRQISLSELPADSAIDAIQFNLRSAERELASVNAETKRIFTKEFKAELLERTQECDRLRADLALACSGPALAAEFERRGIAEADAKRDLVTIGLEFGALKQELEEATHFASYKVNEELQAEHAESCKSYEYDISVLTGERDAAKAELARLNKSIVVYGTENLRLEGQLVALAAAAQEWINFGPYGYEMGGDSSGVFEKLEAELAKVKRP